MNVFGERQNVEKYIPMVIKKVRDGNEVTVHADSNKKIPGSRHYIHAKDVADALLFYLTMIYQNLNQMRQEQNAGSLTL